MAFGLVEIYHCSNIFFQSQNFHLTILLPKFLPENDLNMNLAHLVDEEFKQLFLKIGEHFVDNLLVGKGLKGSLELELNRFRDEDFLYSFQDELWGFLFTADDKLLKFVSDTLGRQFFWDLELGECWFYGLRVRGYGVQ